MKLSNKALKEKLLARVIKENDCWIWTGTTASRNRAYGVMYNGEKNGYVHRFSYELYKGEIPKGLLIDHLCNSTLCINPKHLEIVTNQENINRSYGNFTGKKPKLLNPYVVKRSKISPEQARELITIRNRKYGKEWIADNARKAAKAKRPNRKKKSKPQLPL